MSFLPSNYVAPCATSENYMKINKGENKIRILSAPILGFEEWIAKKPVRYRMGNQPVKATEPDGILRHFWAFLIWNYQEEKIQILNLTQATLRKKLENLSKDQEWGAPYHYDIKIIKEGEEILTKYDVNPMPHKSVRQDIINAFHAKPANLEALFDSQDPFAQGWDSYTPGVFNQNDGQTSSQERDSSSSNKFITPGQVLELNSVIKECSPLYLQTLMERLQHSSINAKSFSQLTPPVYEKVMAEAKLKRDEFQKLLKEENECPF